MFGGALNHQRLLTAQNFKNMQTDLKKHETHTDASNVLGCVFIINFDEAIIFKTDKDLRFYDTHYNNFDKAKK